MPNHFIVTPTKFEIKHFQSQAYAVFLVERYKPGHENVIEKPGVLLNVCDSLEEAKAYIESIHQEGNKYFITEGYFII